MTMNYVYTHITYHIYEYSVWMFLVLSTRSGHGNSSAGSVAVSALTCFPLMTLEGRSWLLMLLLMSVSARKPAG